MIKIIKNIYYIILFFPYYLYIEHIVKRRKKLTLLNYDIYKSIFKLKSIIKNPLNKTSQKKYLNDLEYNFKTEKKLTYNKYKIDYKKINIFIISYNRLLYLENMISSLEKYNLKNIHIIDNNSTYKPLLYFYKNIKYPVHKMKYNYGHLVFWKNKYFKQFMTNYPYIVTDPDLELNKKMPENFIDTLFKFLYIYKNITKVGFSLEINDLPNTKLSEKIRKWESQYWINRLDTNIESYVAEIDTTFALYKPGILCPYSYNFFNAIRIAGSYTARHLPWYKNTLTEEYIYYKNNSCKRSATWINESQYY